MTISTSMLCCIHTFKDNDRLMKTKEIEKKLSNAGLQSRPAQIEMIQSVYNAVQKKQLLTVEAPTGTGKTVSYCLGSYFARPAKKTIIISTSTIALQEQLIKKDLPLLEKILGKKLNIGLAKGRRRYVCHARLLKQDWQADLLESSPTLDTLKLKLQKSEWFGDRDELNESIDEKEWRNISTDASGCSGSLCEYYEECAFFRARKTTHQADIIVVNHNLLLSDLELGGGIVLPPPDKCIYIIDECHHLPEKALNHFAKSDTIMGSVEWINGLTKTLSTAVKEELITEGMKQTINDLTHELVQSLTAMRDAVVLKENVFEDNIWRITETPDDINEIAKNIKVTCAQVIAQGEQMHQDLELNAKQSSLDPTIKEAYSKIIASLGFALNRANNLYETWELFTHKRRDKEAPVARWFEQRQDAFFCHASPINVSQKLKTLFWSKAVNGAILCSATITALGKFDDYNRKSGLKECKNAVSKSVASCFDYSKSVLYLPKMTNEPSGFNQSAHIEETIRLLPDLILPTAGTLILFSSRKAMETVFDQMPDSITADSLVQSFQSKNKLIEKHKTRIRHGKRSIIFGLASFGEGLDLPADFCQHVIIHKVPFAVPSTPIELTRNEWLKKNNLNAFMLSSLPAASIRLTQYVGRLIRQETDIGIVTILDKRLYSKQYGSLLLANLPGFEHIINQDISVLKTHATVRKLICYQEA